MIHGRLWGLTAQNNPETACVEGSDWQAMCWSANQTQQWIQECLGPSLKEYGYEHIKLMIVDDDRQYLKEWADTFINHTALDYISGFAVHAYDEATDPSVLDSVNKDFPDKFLLSTEFCDRQVPPVALGSWERGEDYARRIFRDLNHYVAGWTDNNLALDRNGGPSWVKHYCDSPIIVDNGTGEFYKQPMFYILGHFSKFIPPGSRVMQSSCISELEVSCMMALTPDGTIVLVLINGKPFTQKIHITDGTNAAEYMVEEYSIYTFSWQKSLL